MRISSLLFFIVLLSSCVGIYGFHGTLGGIYKVEANSSIRLIAEPFKSYTFDLKNTSLEKVILSIKTGKGNVVKLKKNEVLKIEYERLDGILVANESDKERIFNLVIYLKNQRLNLPKAETIKN